MALPPILPPGGLPYRPAPAPAPPAAQGGTGGPPILPPGGLPSPPPAAQGGTGGPPVLPPGGLPSGASGMATVAQALARRFIPQTPHGAIPVPLPGSKLSGLTNLANIGQQWHALNNYMVQRGYVDLAHQTKTDPLLLLYQHSNSWDRQLINNLTFLVQHGEGTKFAPPVTFPNRYPSGGPTNPMQQPPVSLPPSDWLAERPVPAPGTYNSSAVAFNRALPNAGLETRGARDIYTGKPIPPDTLVMRMAGAKGP